MARRQGKATAAEIEAVLRAGGVVTIDGKAWSVDRKHAEEDMPPELREPASSEEADDELLERQWQWWETLELCGDEGTDAVELIEALCKVAGVRVRGV